MSFYDYVADCLKKSWDEPDYTVSRVSNNGDGTATVTATYEQPRYRQASQTVKVTAVVAATVEEFRALYGTPEAFGFDPEIVSWVTDAPNISLEEADMLDALEHQETWATERDRQQYLTYGFVE